MHTQAASVTKQIFTPKDAYYQLNQSKLHRFPATKQIFSFLDFLSKQTDFDAKKKKKKDRKKQRSKNLNSNKQQIEENMNTVGSQYVRFL